MRSFPVFLNPTNWFKKFGLLIICNACGLELGSNHGMSVFAIVMLHGCTFATGVLNRIKTQSKTSLKMSLGLANFQFLLWFSIDDSIGLIDKRPTCKNITYFLSAVSKVLLQIAGSLLLARPISQKVQSQLRSYCITKTVLCLGKQQ